MDGERDGIDPLLLERMAAFLRPLRSYFRLRVDGLDHVPQSGAALLVANHTGWLGLDYALTAVSLYDGIGRIPRGMAHKAWFQAKATRDFAGRVGLFEVSKEAIQAQLAAGRLVMMFPEGEKGAFRPGSDYQLEAFARGFVRVAATLRVPVVPIAILGGEESNPIGSRIESYEELLQLKGGLPIPKNIIPRPVKWRICFLPPYPLPPGLDPEDRDAVVAFADAVRDLIQGRLKKMKAERGHPFL